MNRLKLACVAILTLAGGLHAAVISLAPVDLAVVSDLTTAGAYGVVDPGTGQPVAVRSRQTVTQNNAQVATFLQFDLSGYTPAMVTSPFFSATFSADFNTRLNTANNLRVRLGRNVNGPWTSTPGTLPLHDWGFQDEGATIIAADSSIFVNNVRTAALGTEFSVDVTSIVANWVTGVNPNNGFVLFYDTNAFQGAGFGNPTLTTVPEPSTVIILALLFPAAFVYARKRRNA